MDDKCKILLMVSIFLSMLVIPLLAFAQENRIIKIIPVKDEISMYEEAIFNLSIINLQTFREDFSIYSPSIDLWSIKINPDIMTVDFDDAEYSKIRIKPKKDVLPGKEYGVQINIKSKTKNELYKAYAFVYVMTQEELNDEYKPILKVDVGDIGVIDPTESYNFNMEIENKNVKDIKDLEIILRSDIFSNRIVTNLGPLKKKTVQFPLTVPAGTPPLTDNLILIIKSQNQTIISKSVDYQIMGIEKYDFTSESVTRYFKTTYNIVLKNTGNLKTIAEYKVRTNLLNYIFINANMDSGLKKIEDDFYKVFQIELEPGQDYQVSIVKSYRPIAYTIIAILVIIALYYLLRSPIIIRKSITNIKTKEDTLSELKILLHIKNRTKKTFEDIIVLDRIPKITEISKDFEIGTIKPIKIMNHEKKGTIAKWEINALDSYEERVIAYKLYANLSILGGLTTPMAILKYRHHNGREKAVSSNKINLVIKKFNKLKN